MQDPSRYHASSSNNKLQYASCSRCFTKCPTCSSSLDDKDYANAISNEYETDSSSDDFSMDRSENFLPRWDRYLSTLSNNASASHKQAIFGLRHEIEEIKISRRRSFNSSRREHKKQDPVSPNMSRLLEFMSENDMPSLSSYSDPGLARLFEYLNIKAGNICRDPSIRPLGKSSEEEVVPEVGVSQPAIHPRCPICLDNFLSGQQVNEMQCKHRFHLKCIETHFKRQREKWCPVCTYNVHKDRSSRGSTGKDWRRFWVCFRGPRIIARNSPPSSPAKITHRNRRT
ncbi:Zinc/RING finger protein 4 [Carex littledalei]|uniref:Zinc/RING finger protein 4 n=1 Tax=Carex littledalei TaxID=544730 RepID=A0A833VKN9_9POAL|nr:Zinc/RING finger protein 4 [Carex littledalei]